MKCVIRYDFDYLQKYCMENNITLMKDYSNDSINRETRIEGKCCTENCPNGFNKTFRYICLASCGSGPICDLCTNNKKVIKQKKSFKEKYLDDPEMLKDLHNRREATCLKKFSISTFYGKRI